MKNLFILLFLFCSTSLAFGQASEPIQNEAYRQMLDSMYKGRIPLMTVEELKNLPKENLFVLDAREFREYKVSHLKMARHVGAFWFDMRRIYDIPRDATIVVYCSVGYRSEKIAEKIQKAGYTQVFNLYGGIFEWVNQGNPVYRMDGVQTSEIHTFNASWARWVERGAKVF